MCQQQRGAPGSRQLKGLRALALARVRGEGGLSPSGAVATAVVKIQGVCNGGQPRKHNPVLLTSDGKSLFVLPMGCRPSCLVCKGVGKRFVYLNFSCQAALAVASLALKQHRVHGGQVAHSGESSQHSFPQKGRRKPGGKLLSNFERFCCDFSS